MDGKKTVKTVKTWLKEGTGEPPLLWSVNYTDRAYRESAFLNAEQYWHVADQMKELAQTKDPAQCLTVDVKAISDFFELRDKGGPLGKINLRVFFIIDTTDHSIVVLGVHKKEDENQLRPAVRRLISRRRRIYFEK